MRIFSAIPGFFLIVLSALRAQPSAPTDDLIRAADGIFTGRVREIGCRRSGKGIIFSDVAFDVEEALKGSFGPQISCTFLGGRIGEETQRASVLPEFEAGERMLLMLRKTENNLNPVMGGRRGKISEKDFILPRFAGARKSHAASGNADFESMLSALRSRLGRASAAPHPAKKPENRTSAPFQGNAYHSFGKIASLPVTFYARPSSDTRVGGSDVRMMASWNRYATIFSSTAGNGTWDFGNNRFEIAGFVGDTELKNEFDLVWSDLNALAFSYSNEVNGVITESDVFLNPGFNLTLDNNLPANDPTVYGMDMTMIHELGHTFGLLHEFTKLSVMNYNQPQYDGDYYVHVDDALGIRSLYPSGMKTVRDVAVYLYKAGNGEFDIRDATLSKSVVAPGSSFNVSGYTLENLGAADTASFTLKWFLVGAYRSLSGNVEIATTTHSLTALSSKAESSDIPVPAAVPMGSYILAAQAQLAGDEVAENNTSWHFAHIAVSSETLMASAGPDQVVNYNATVTLDGSASANGLAGSTMSYSWTQTSGQGVTLSSASSARPTFKASTNGALTFRLTVNNGAATSSDTVTVTIVAFHSAVDTTGMPEWKDFIEPAGGAQTPYAQASSGGGGGCLLNP